MFEETKKLIDHANSNNDSLSELSDQRAPQSSLLRKVLVTAVALAAIAALIVAAIISRS
jgi:hypothetical protein